MSPKFNLRDAADILEDNYEEYAEFASESLINIISAKIIERFTQIVGKNPTL